jgi:hypothetical protein
MTAAAQSDVENEAKKSSKRRTPEQKYGVNRWHHIEQHRTLTDLRETKALVQQIFLGLSYLMQYGSQFLEDVVTKDDDGHRDDLDLAILDVLRQAPASGILPKDIYAKVGRYGLAYHHITRRIKRMNKRLRKKTSQNAAVKVGNRWSLSPFMRQNWGAKLEELDEEIKTEEGEL